MALTKEQVKARILPKLTRSAMEQMTWAEFASAIAAAGAQTKAELLGLVRGGNARELGAKIIAVAGAKAQEQAGAKADALIADDALSLAELEDVL
jgi:hypothetical protein